MRYAPVVAPSDGNPPPTAAGMNIEVGHTMEAPAPLESMFNSGGLPKLRLEHGTATPLYEQLAEWIATAIASGQLREGAPLPAERLISEQLEVSRTTVRKALDELVRADWSPRAKVRAPTSRPPGCSSHWRGLSSFSDDMRARGRRPGFVWVERGVFEPSPEETIALGLGNGEQVARLVRVRLRGRGAARGRASRHCCTPSARPGRRGRTRSTRRCATEASHPSAPSSTCGPPRWAPPTRLTSRSRPAARSWPRFATATSSTADRSNSLARSIAATATTSSLKCAMPERRHADL